MKHLEYQEKTILAADLSDYIGWSAQGIQSTESPLWGSIEAAEGHATRPGFMVVTIGGNGHMVRVDNPITGEPHMVTVGRSVEVQPLEDNDAEVAASIAAHDLALPADDGSETEGTPAPLATGPDYVVKVNGQRRYTGPLEEASRYAESTSAMRPDARVELMEAPVATPAHMIPELHAVAITSANAATIQFGTLTLWYSYATLIAFRTPATGLVVSENLWGSATAKHLNAIPGAGTANRGDRLGRGEFEALAARVAFAAHNGIVAAFGTEAGE